MAESGFFGEEGELDLADHDEEEQSILAQLGDWRAAHAGGKPASSAKVPDGPVDWKPALLLKKGKGKTKQTFPAHAPAAPANKAKKTTVAEEVAHVADACPPTVKSNMWDRTEKEKKNNVKIKRRKWQQRRKRKGKLAKTKRNANAVAHLPHPLLPPQVHHLPHR